MTQREGAYCLVEVWSKEWGFTYFTKRIINIVNNIVVWDGKECSQLVYPRTHSRTIDPRKIKT